jgi:hypothetical protein
MKGYVLILLVVLSGCTTVSDLKQPEKSLEFTINEDLLVFYNAGGIFEGRYVRGILKGTYTAIAEDVDGYYFVPVDGRVVRLAGPHAEEFEKTRVYPEHTESNISGVWLPKLGSQRPADMFFITGVGSLKDHYQPGRGGAITYGVSHLIEGSVLFWHDPVLPDMSGLLSKAGSK